jgi:pimeloyl-ACP methyl ester carboxylesterase
MFPEPRFVDTADVRLAIYEAGDGPPVILLHGFPEIAFSWRHQLAALAGAGYRVVAPDQRGYGRSSVPDEVEAYAIDKLAGDVTGLMDALGLATATIVGHDWGALVAWHLALTQPRRIDRLAALNVPLTPRPPVDPIAIFRKRFGNDYYIVNFQDSDEADRVFDADPGRVIDRLYRKNQLSRADFDELPEKMKTINLLRTVTEKEASGDALLTAEEREVYVEAFERSGFTGPINWYRNWTRNWERQADTAVHVDLPTLFIGAADDVVIPLALIEGMRPLVSDLRIHMLEDCGHWSQQERPAEVNRLLLDFLGEALA